MNIRSDQSFDLHSENANLNVSTKETTVFNSGGDYSVTAPKIDLN